ncbi:unnamed protein product, partial [Scytosiphon promiscuus]
MARDREEGTGGGCCVNNAEENRSSSPAGRKRAKDRHKIWSWRVPRKTAHGMRGCVFRLQALHPGFRQRRDLRLCCRLL